MIRGYQYDDPWINAWVDCASGPTGRGASAARSGPRQIGEDRPSPAAVHRAYRRPRCEPAHGACGGSRRTRTGLGIVFAGLGRLRNSDDGDDWLLQGRNFIGRSRACTICVERPEVSGEHAVLRWAGAGWEVKDLHSRNGVFVDGRRLPPGERTLLHAGCRLGFGREGGHELVDAGEPTAFAVPLAGAGPIEAVGGILALPDPHAPVATIFRDGDGWSLDRAGETGPVVDGAIVRVQDGAWRVHLPELLLPTDVGDGTPPLAGLLLRFSVSRDEEYVELVAVHERQLFDLQARSHHYALLLLARARLRHQGLPPARQGWIHQHELLAQLRVDRNKLHLDIFRLRRQFGEAGIRDAAGIVERRANTSQLRIGVSRIEIVPLDR